jgi:hypothetical protein
MNALSLGCRALITTRDASLAAALGAQEQPLDVMTLDEALSLLSEWSGRPIPQLPSEARDRLWVRQSALALAMIGAMVRNKPARTWADVLHLLQNADLEGRSAWHSHNLASQARQPTPGELIGEGGPVFGRLQGDRPWTRK